MRPLCLVLAVLFVNVNAGNVWLKDLISPKGWDLGYGVVLKLNESHKGKNMPIMERLSLDLNLGDLVGVSVGKARSDGVELDFYVKKNVDYQEGRGKKEGGKHMLQMLIGYKAALMISAMFAIMKLLTMKAIFLAKAALIISVVLLLLKLKHHHAPEIIEVEQHGYPSHVPHYIEKDHGSGFHGSGGFGGGGYGGGFGHHSYGREAQASNAYQDLIYAPSAAAAIGAESNAVYAAATTSDAAIKSVGVARKSQDVNRRRDNLYYNKPRDSTGNGSMFSLKKYASAET